MCIANCFLNKILDLPKYFTIVPIILLFTLLIIHVAKYTHIKRKYYKLFTYGFDIFAKYLQFFCFQGCKQCNFWRKKKNPLHVNKYQNLTLVKSSNEMIYHWYGLKYFSAPLKSLHPKAFVNKHSAIKSRRIH
jgi:hypothetical protein